MIMQFYEIMIIQLYEDYSTLWNYDYAILWNYDYAIAIYNCATEAYSVTGFKCIVTLYPR